MKEYYSYPCEQADDCIDFLEGAKKYSSFKEFCEKKCGNCPDCIVMDMPYPEEDFKGK